MSPKDRKLAGLLLILLAILAVTFSMGRRLNQLPPPAGTDGDATGAQTSLADDISSVEIPDLIGPRASEEAEVERNPFAYAPRPSTAVGRAQPAVEPSRPTVAVPPPAPPPPPPRIPFRYSGYGSSDPSSGAIQAILFDNDNRPYPVSEREILMGRYRISRISESFVDVEDLELGRSERLPLEIE